MTYLLSFDLDDEPDGDEATLLAANAFNAACILCCELNELRLPNCDREFNAFNVAAVAALFPTDWILLPLLFDRGDSLDKLVWVDDVFDELETGPCNDDVPPNGIDLNVFFFK